VLALGVFLEKVPDWGTDSLKCSRCAGQFLRSFSPFHSWTTASARCPGCTRRTRLMRTKIQAYHRKST
jgi:DNA-directed RNA polymerase subunit RPC12/RpoP